MKHYFLFDSLIEREKTAPFLRSALVLLEHLHIDAIPFKGAKADVGSEYKGLDEQKFLEHYAYNLSLAAREKRAILCIEQSSFISHAYTKDILQNDATLSATIAERLEKQNLTLSLDVEVCSLEQLLIEEIGLEKLQEELKHPFSEFQVALFRGTNACRARKYTKEESLTKVLNSVQLKTIPHASTYESDGYEVLYASPLLAKKLASRAMLDMFDHAADFVLVVDARSFVMFDFYQKELEKVAGREINLSVLTLPELLALALGIHDKKRLGLDHHKIPLTLI